MRHTRAWVAAAGVAASAGVSGASPLVATVEGGAEYDSNVQRVETGPALSTMRLGGSVFRFGGKIEKKDRLAGGTYAASAGVLARIVSESTAASENVALFSADARYLRPVSGRQFSLGASAAAVDASGISEDVGARTFRNLAADALLVLDGGETTRLGFAVGARRFTYKENSDFDWAGPAASVRFDTTLWAPSNGTRSLELSMFAGFEMRDYDAVALANVCPPGAPPDHTCSAGTRLPRRDRMQRAGVELTLVSPVVAALGYQVAVVDSNSFGQSLVRHKVTASATTTLFENLYGTVLAQLQLDQYLDGLVIEADTQRSEFTNLDDENRSSLQLRVGRPMTEALSIEARVAAWANLGVLGSGSDAEFRRTSVYIGAIWTR